MTGGETGKSEDYNEDRIDCRGICDGGWVEDACGYCEPQYLNFEIDPSSQSRYMDCNNTCFVPGKRKEDLLYLFYLAA